MQENLDNTIFSDINSNELNSENPKNNEKLNPFIYLLLLPIRLIKVLFYFHFGICLFSGGITYALLFQFDYKELKRDIFLGTFKKNTLIIYSSLIGTFYFICTLVLIIYYFLL